MFSPLCQLLLPERVPLKQMELDRLRERVNELEGKRASSSGVKKEVIKDDPDDITDLT